MVRFERPVQVCAEPATRRRAVGAYSAFHPSLCEHAVWPKRNQIAPTEGRKFLKLASHADKRLGSLSRPGGRIGSSLRPRQAFQLPSRSGALGCEADCSPVATE